MYERYASMNQGLYMPVCSPGKFVQYVADNIDHDSRTIDVCCTFHGMGIIATVKPKSDVASVVTRRENVSRDDIADVGRISIKQFTSAGDGLESLRYESLPITSREDCESLVNLLWKTYLPLRYPSPAWFGFMQMIYKGNQPGQALVMFLPMIDMNPSDFTCINST